MGPRRASFSSTSLGPVGCERPEAFLFFAMLSGSKCVVVESRVRCEYKARRKQRLMLGSAQRQQFFSGAGQVCTELLIAIRRSPSMKMIVLHRLLASRGALSSVQCSCRDQRKLLATSYCPHIVDD